MYMYTCVCVHIYGSFQERKEMKKGNKITISKIEKSEIKKIIETCIILYHFYYRTCNIVL